MDSMIWRERFLESVLEALPDADVMSVWDAAASASRESILTPEEAASLYVGSAESVVKRPGVFPKSCPVLVADARLACQETRVRIEEARRTNIAHQKTSERSVNVIKESLELLRRRPTRDL